MGNEHLKQNDHSSSIKCFNEALKIKPNNSNAISGKVKSLIGLGEIELKNNKFDIALQKFMKALEIDPKNQYAKKGKMNVLIGKGKLAITF